jgi:hypothetical protein
LEPHYYKHRHLKAALRESGPLKAALTSIIAYLRPP